MKIIRYSDTINEATKTRGDITTLVVKIGDKTFFNKEASITFYQVIEYISQNVGVDKFIKDNIEISISGRKIIGLKPEDFPTYAKQGLKQSSTDKFIISTHSSTEVKKSILEYLLKFYNIKGTVEIRNRVEKIEKSNINDEVNLTDSEVESEEFENKGEYPDDVLKSKLIYLLKSNLAIISKFIIFLKILLSENKKFTREEIKKKLIEKINSVDFSNPSRKFSSEGQAGVYLSHFSQFITKGTNDYLRQIIDYDTIRWSPDAETDTGAKKDNYQIVDSYRNLLSEVLSEVSVDKISDIIEKKPVEKPVINPFGGESTKNSDKNTSAICVLGESGAGKTFRIEKTLENENHISEIIIPSSSTTNLLVQYTKGEYVLSRLGNFILKANSDKSHYYTIVFDECHKYIEMINDELLQCISTKRNDGLRFISLDPVTDKLFSELPEKNGRRVIPDNLGFIFISSKEAIIRDNSDFYNRVDIITINKSDRDIDFAIEILKNKIEGRKDEEYSME